MRDRLHELAAWSEVRAEAAPAGVSTSPFRPNYAGVAQVVEHLADQGVARDGYGASDVGDSELVGHRISYELLDRFGLGASPADGSGGTPLELVVRGDEDPDEVAKPGMMSCRSSCHASVEAASAS